MATNYVQPGDTMSVAAPYDRLSGEGALVGSMFGVCVTDALSGETVQINTRGVWTLAKTSAQAWTVGAKVYWDDTNKVATTTSTSNTLIGVAAAAAANPSSTGNVRLNGSF
jgi:predicted RecA/RadA family phage recombinase